MLFDDKLSDIIRTLESDGVLLHPTDTIWSISCSIHSKNAFEKILKITNIDYDQPLTLLVDSFEMLKKHVPHIHPRIETLLHYHHKPLTIIYPDVINIPSYIKKKDKRIAIQLIHDVYCNKIIHLLGNALFSTSANIFGQPYPKRFDEIPKNIMDGADYISKQMRNDQTAKFPSVLIDYDQEGEINFLRH